MMKKVDENTGKSPKDTAMNAGYLGEGRLKRSFAVHRT